MGITKINTSNLLKKDHVYLQMDIDDNILFTDYQFFTIRKILEEHTDITHISTKIYMLSANINKNKYKDINIPPYITITSTVEINKKIDNYDLMVVNILMQIYDSIKEYIVLH